MIFRKRPDIIARPEGNKMLVFRQEIHRVFILNPTSTFLWESCTGERPVEEIGRMLAERFELPEEYAEPSRRTDLVTGHLDLLCKAGLLEASA